MKCVLVFCLVASLVGLILAQNNSLCYSGVNVSGDCTRRIRGFTYVPETKRCQRFRTRGCTVTGNFFHSRGGCRIKCVSQSRNSSDGHNRFVAFVNRAMSQFHDMMTSLLNYTRP